MLNTSYWPRVSTEAEPYWEGLHQKELRYQYCASCQRAVFPPRACCPYCLERPLQWKVSNGKGKIYSFSVVHRPLPNWRSPAPYTVGIIRMAEDYFTFTEVVGCPPEKVSVDMDVQVSFDEVEPKLILARFHPINV